MKVLFFLILFWISFFKRFTQAISESETTLVSIQTVFNHGIRSPLHNYPNNPNDIWSRYSSSLGQLTDLGMKQMYDYGVFLRQKYPSLNSTYDRTRAWALATDHDRNLQSAQMVMTGLFQPNQNTIWIKNSNLTGFYPVPIHTAPVECDQIFHRHSPCPRFNEIQEEARMANVAKENASEGILWKMKCQSNIDLGYYDLWRLGDKALIDAAHGLSVDKYISEEMNRLMDVRNNNFYVSYISTLEQAQLISGALLNQIVSYFYRKISRTTQNELYLYGAFDYYLSGLQRLMSTTSKFTQPNFGAAFIFELRKDSNGNHFVQTLWKDNAFNESITFNPVNVLGCEIMCPVDKFRSLVSPYLVTSFDEICKQKKLTVTSTTSTTTTTTTTTGSTGSKVTTTTTLRMA
ncbi:unnamed protein product [Brachionus calyciflorus]|uniref:acid phosphatase n=1 Tax=Brachionus calyciflorus TaxID=104777 RepID=A0A813SAQ4_9BILA|nr:unnamed protein product [Brachionus calyciflorus]